MIEDFLRDEFIGLKVKVIKSTNKYEIGIKGKIIDETYNLLIIETKKGIKKIVKKNCTFVFWWNNFKLKVDGKLIVGRPEDRIKKKFKK